MEGANKIIKNRRYIGIYTYDDIVIEDGIPAIISKDTFQLAQLEMERRRTRKRPKPPKAEYLLSGKAFCGHCQKPLTRVSGTGRSGSKWYYYYCPDSRAKKGCDKKPVQQKARKPALPSNVQEIPGGKVVHPRLGVLPPLPGAEVQEGPRRRVVREGVGSLVDHGGAVRQGPALIFRFRRLRYGGRGRSFFPAFGIGQRRLIGLPQLSLIHI